MPSLFEKKPEKKEAAEAAKAVRAAIRGRIPEKRTINLATVNANRIDWGIATPLLVVVVLAVIVFGKFAVVDRLADVARARAEVKAVQEQLREGYAQIESFGDINDLYAHYTYSGMTEEELGRVSRVEMMEMIHRVVHPLMDADKWEVNENMLVIEIQGRTLLEINQVVAQLLKEDIVEFCTVSMAEGTIGGMETSDTVNAEIVVHLVKPQTEEVGA